MKKLLLFTFIFLWQYAFSQIPADSLNRHNDKNKKHGFWKVYLTEQLVEIKDTSKAYYYGYNYYENGELVILIEGGERYKRKSIKTVSDGEKATMGKPILLNGNFKLYHEKGLAVEEKYINGLPVTQTTYDPNNTDNPPKIETLDYTKQYNGQFGSCYYEWYYGDGSIRSKFWIAKNEKGKWTYIKK